MSDDSERRRTRRVRLPETHGSLLVSLEGSVLDISLSGMSIETNTRLAPQRTLSLRLGNGGEAMQLSGFVVWCFLHGTRSTHDGEQFPVYRAGIQFRDVLSPQAQELLRFLESHAIVTLETRLFGRFRVNESDPVEVSSSAGFRVVELNSNGLVVETTLGLEPRTGRDVELALEGTTLTAATRVVDAHRLTERAEETWQVQLEFVEIAADEREKLTQFLRGALGSHTVEPE
jgi:hypothetical protein